MAKRQVRLAGTGPNSEGIIDRGFGQIQTLSSMVCSNEVNFVVCPRELTVSKHKGRIARYCFAKEPRRLNQVVPSRHVKVGRLEQILAAQIKIVCFQVGGRSLFDCRLLTRRDFCLELLRNCFGDFALYCKDVS
jgi:hypothetical protein